MLALRLDLIEIIGFLAQGKTLQETQEEFGLPSTRAVKDRVKQFEKELGGPIFNMHKPGESFVWEPASDAAREALLTLYAMGRDIALIRHICKAFSKPPERTKPSGHARTSHVEEASMLIYSDAEKVAKELEIPAYQVKRGLYILEDYFGAKLLHFYKDSGYVPTKVMKWAIQQLFHGLECSCNSLRGAFEEPPTANGTY